jgi:hypothetical protein
MGKADSSVHDQFNQFKDLIHQKDEGKNHEANKEDRKNLLEDIKIGGLSHCLDILREEMD